ncbi:glycosyltransferase [Vibrio breoganii]
MNQKKLLIIMPSGYMGGTNSSLENMLRLIDHANLDVEIFPLCFDGPFVNRFSQYICRKENIFLSANKRALSSSRYGIISKLLIVLFSVMKAGKNSFIREFVFTKIAKNFTNYDVVVSFQEGVATDFASRIECDNKIAWIHCDYSRYLSAVNRDELATYNRFSSIVCVSSYTKDVFVNIYPSLTDKTVAIHNLIDTRYIKLKSKEVINLELNPNVDVIVSLGRLDKVKRFEKIPEIAKELVSVGLNFKWYIIGDGKEYDRIRANIKMLGLEDYVKLTGALENPYPLISQSKILVCTSSSEACPNVINEAKTLSIPIISADFGSSYEMLDNGRHGYITSIDRIGDEIKKFLSDKEKYLLIKDNLKTEEYNNQLLLEEIYRLIYKAS